MKLATIVAKKLDTENFKATGFESCVIDNIKFSAIQYYSKIDVTATTTCNGNIITIASSMQTVFYHSIATCVANLLGYKGEWSLNEIRKQIEQKEQDQLEWSDFCEELGYDN